MPTIEVRRTAELTVPQLYALLQLRASVFVVEQDCAYLDLDGRDLEPDCLQLWVSGDRGVDACLRLLSDPDDVARIGRVCTSPAARGRGLAAELIRRAIDLVAGRPVVLDAQSQLAGWYAGLGFVVSGEEFLEDGIPHLPMRRER